MLETIALETKSIPTPIEVF